MQHRFGIQGPSKLPCLSLRYHIAQKLHGMTASDTSEQRNDRARDAADVLLFLEAFESSAQLAALREACVAVFESRERHQWPPDFDPPARWRDEFERIAADLQLNERDFDQAQRVLRDFIGCIASVDTPVTN